jgi:hypothetical protein
VSGVEQLEAIGWIGFAKRRSPSWLITAEGGAAGTGTWSEV